MQAERKGKRNKAEDEGIPCPLNFLFTFWNNPPDQLI